MEPANLFNDVRAIFLNLEGTLIAVDRIEHESYQMALDPLGKRIGLETFRRLAGKTRRDTCRALVSQLQLKTKWSELARAQEEAWQRIARAGKVPVIRSAVEFVRAVPRDKYKFGLVTGYSIDEIEWALDRIGLIRSFDAVISGSELPKRPEPDLYNVAIDVVGSRGRNSVAIESCPEGVISAARAGARAVAVPNETTRDNDFSAAHVRVDSLDHLIPFL